MTIRPQTLFISAIILFLGIFGLAENSLAATCSSINQNGITWIFDHAYECGQFVNGDWWVIGPVTINSQTPAWDGIKNGAMLDPPTGTYIEGYDTRGSSYYMTYDNSLRVSFPTTISSGVKSLISVIGVASYDPNVGQKSFIDNAAVLTVVNSAPSVNSFRPPFVAGAKPIYDNSSVNYALIPSYSPPPTALNLTGVMNMPWLNYGSRTFGEENMMPMKDMYGTAYPPYGSDSIVGQMSMMMMLNTANRVSYINKLIQLGIDDYAKANTTKDPWMAAGGYGMDHLWPILFSGIMLDNTTMKNIGRSTFTYTPGYRFAEQGWTYYNNKNVVMFGSDECSSGYSTWAACTSNCMCRDPNGVLFPENMPNGGAYRQVISRNFPPEALAMRMLEPSLGTMTLFNHPSFFDYADYWAANCKSYDWTPCSSGYITDLYGFGGTGNGFMQYMWDTYRGAITAPDTIPPSAPTGLSVI